MIALTPEPDEVGTRVDLFVALRTGRPRAQVQRALRDGRLVVRGATVKPSHRLEPGDVVTGEMPPIEEEAAPAPEPIELDVAYSDDRVLVVDKPAGLVTHPGAGHAGGTLINALLARGEPLAATGSQRPGIVHRLDKETSGLLLVARDNEAHTYLTAALKQRRIERRYRALVRGIPRSPSGTIDAPIGRHPIRRKKMAVLAEGRPAITHFAVAGSGPGCALLDVSLESGRTHQIRVHLAHLGHPVLGDSVYGGKSELARELGLTRPFLHAYRLTFPHPDDGRQVTVTSPLPGDLAGALDKAGVALPATEL